MVQPPRVKASLSVRMSPRTKKRDSTLRQFRQLRHRSKDVDAFISSGYEAGKICGLLPLYHFRGLTKMVIDIDSLCFTRIDSTAYCNHKILPTGLAKQFLKFSSEPDFNLLLAVFARNVIKTMRLNFKNFSSPNGGFFVTLRKIFL